MNKLISLGLGLAIGIVAGAVVMVLAAPSSGDDLRENLRRGYQDTLDEARRTSQARKLELEADLARRRGNGITLP